MAMPHDLQVMSPTHCALENLESQKFASLTLPPSPPKHMTDPEQRLLWLMEFQRQKEESQTQAGSFQSAESPPQLLNSFPSPLPVQSLDNTFDPRAENDFFGFRSKGNNTDRYPFLVSSSAVPNDLFGPRSQPEETLSVLPLPDWRLNSGAASSHYLIGAAGGDSVRENVFNFVENVQNQAGGDSVQSDSRSSVPPSSIRAGLSRMFHTDLLPLR